MAYDKQGAVGNLANKSRVELTELLQRQEKLLSNKRFIATLPDKGNKIRKFKEQIQQTLDTLKQKGTREVDETAELLARLRLGSSAFTRQPVTLDELDSDDEENTEELMQDTDVWTTLATNGSLELKSVISVTAIHKDDNGRRSSARSNNGSVSSSKHCEPQVDVYKGLANVFDQQLSSRSLIEKKSFKPFKSTKHSSIKEISSKLTKPPSIPRMLADIQRNPVPLPEEEESAVRYPTGPHKSAVTVSLQESLQMQEEYLKRLAELQLSQSVERLADKMNIKMMDDYVPDTEAALEYRETKRDIESEEEDANICTEIDMENQPLPTSVDES